MPAQEAFQRWGLGMACSQISLLEWRGTTEHEEHCSQLEKETFDVAGSWKHVLTFSRTSTKRWNSEENEVLNRTPIMDQIGLFRSSMEKMLRHLSGKRFVLFRKKT